MLAPMHNICSTTSTSSTHTGFSKKCGQSSLTQPPVRLDHEYFVLHRYDPNKVFESIIMKQVIDKSGSFYGPQCDVKRQCFCKEDSHCAAGFACVPSMAHPQYKVCKPVSTVLSSAKAGALLG
jgi:hypothetical protein